MLEKFKNLTIRKKFLFIGAGVLLISSVSIIVANRHILYGNYIKLEHEAAEKDNIRVRNSLNKELEHLKNICEDWSSWDDTYSFIRSRSRHYIERNLSPELFESELFDFISIITTNGEIIFSRMIVKGGVPGTKISDLDDKRKKKISDFIEKNREINETRAGITSTPDGIMLFTVSPILTSIDTGKINGYIIIGRYITDDLQRKLREQTEVEFELLDLMNRDIFIEHKDYIYAISHSVSGIILIENKNSINCMSLYNNIHGNPGLIIKSTSGRELSKQGNRVITTSLIIVFCGLLILMTLVWIMLNYVVIKPVEHLKRQVKSIEEEKYDRSMVLTAGDELGHLSHVINTMAKTIIRKRDRLNEVNRQLELLSITDGLTGVYNRRYFDERIKNEWERGIRAREPISVIMCDVDFFKKYNDIYGHQAGDECLKNIASALKSSVHRTVDEVYRYGGEEFIVLLPDTTSDGALHVALKMLKSVFSCKIEHKGSPEYGSVTISLGASTIIPQSGYSFDELISHADIALYESKKKGRNRVHLAAMEDGVDSFMEFCLRE